MALFGNLFGDAGTQTQAGVTRATGYENAYGAAAPFYGAAQGNINQYFGQAAQPWQAIVNPTQAGLSAYADVTGAGGTAGQNRAQQLFQTDPGYQFALNQQQQAIQRAAGPAGGEYSGNLLDALQRNAAGYAGQQYGNWANRLYQLAAMAPTGAQGLAGVLTGQGTNLAGLNVAQGNLNYNTQAAAANAIAQGMTNAADVQNASSAAGMNLAAKLLGYGLNGPAGAAALGGGSLGGAGGASGGAGGGAGQGSFFSQLFGTGGGGQFVGNQYGGGAPPGMAVPTFA